MFVGPDRGKVNDINTKVLTADGTSGRVVIARGDIDPESITYSSEEDYDNVYFDSNLSYFKVTRSWDYTLILSERQYGWGSARHYVGALSDGYNAPFAFAATLASVYEGLPLSTSTPVLPKGYPISGETVLQMEGHVATRTITLCSEGNQLFVRENFMRDGEENPLPLLIVPLRIMLYNALSV